MFCGKCGSKIEDGAKFCPSCGASVVTENVLDLRGENKKKRSKVGIKIVVILIVLGVSICSLWYGISNMKPIVSRIETYCLYSMDILVYRYMLDPYGNVAWLDNAGILMYFEYDYDDDGTKVKAEITDEEYNKIGELHYDTTGLPVEGKLERCYKNDTYENSIYKFIYDENKCLVNVHELIYDENSVLIKEKDYRYNEEQMRLIKSSWVEYHDNGEIYFEYLYDEYGNLVSLKMYAPDGDVILDNKCDWQYKFDGNDKLIEAQCTTYLFGELDEKCDVTYEYSYDKEGNLTDFCEKEKSYSYDEEGNISDEQERIGIKIHVTYYE